MRGRNTGKLATLMGITLDIFFEVRYTYRLSIITKYCLDYNTLEAFGLAPAVPCFKAVQSDVHEQVCAVAVDRGAEER